MPAPEPKAPNPIALARRNKIKAFLTAKGHAAGKINALRMRDDDELRDELLSLHGVDREEYRRITGR